MNKQLIIKQIRRMDSVDGLTVARMVINVKVRNQVSVLRRFLGSHRPYPPCTAETKQDILLYEARVAARYWQQVRHLVNPHIAFTHRSKHHEPFNKLLDIGYHHLSSKIKHQIQKRDLWPEVGFLHTAGMQKQPLVYDVMELYRQPIVDFVAIKMIRAKKVQIMTIDENDIARLIKMVTLSYTAIESMIETQMNEIYDWIISGNIPVISGYPWRNVYKTQKTQPLP